MRVREDREGEYQSWSSDQVTKSLFFHQKLHEWNLVSVAEELEAVKGETLDWSDLPALAITEKADDTLSSREFDLWRGMAAGSQAQGSWQNAKGQEMEMTVKGILLQRLQSKSLIRSATGAKMVLKDERLVVFADEPDVAIYEHGQILTALEIKGGIDTAGILERVGAAIKSLQRVKEENPQSVTILLMRQVSMTPKAESDLQLNRQAVNYWYTIESFLEGETVRERIFALLGI